MNTPSDLIKTAYNQTRWSLILRGILGIVIGVLILTRPMASVAALALVIALWALADGIANIVRAFTVRNVAKHWWLFLVAGIVGVLFGVAAMYNFPTLSLAFAVAWIAIWLLVVGATSVYIAFQERKLGMSWGWTMTFGVIAIAVAALEFSNPGITLAGLMGLIAGFGIVGGISMLLAAARMGSIERKIHHAHEDATRDLQDAQKARDEQARRDRDSRAA